MLGSIALAMAFSIVPLPESSAYFRPPWVALVVLYWTLHTPARFGLGAAWACGLLLDVLAGSALGQHALALVLPSYFALKLRLQVRVFPLPQQMLTIAVLVAIYEFIVLWVDGITGGTTGGWERWAPVASGFLVWPVLVVTLDRLRKQRRRAG